MSLSSLPRHPFACALGIALLAPAAVHAQDGFLFDEPRVSVGVRGGYHAATAGSDVYDDFVERLTVERSDFSGFTIVGELGVRLTSHLDLVGSVGLVESDVQSESRTHTADPPILQATSLRRIPVIATLRYYPLSRGRSIGSHAWIPSRFTPWVGVGAGATQYDLQQDGEFVDYTTCDQNNECDIIATYLDSSGWGRALHVAGGADYWVTSRFGVSTDLRYQWSSAALDSFTYEGFEDIDLGGFQGTVGLSVRF